MTWLLEERQSALMIVIIGVITALILGVGWSKTGRKEVLFALGAVVLLSAGLLVLQKVVTTEAEKVEATLAVIAGDVEKNDVQAVLAHVDPRASEIRAQVENFPSQFRFTKVDITRIKEVKVDLKHVPPKAVAEFNVIVAGTGTEFFDGEDVPRFVIVTFHKENGRWRVVHYEHDGPQRAIMK